MIGRKRTEGKSQDMVEDVVLFGGVGGGRAE